MSCPDPSAHQIQSSKKGKIVPFCSVDTVLPATASQSPKNIRN